MSETNPACTCGHRETDHFDGLSECNICECEAFEESLAQPTPDNHEEGSSE